MSAQFLQSSTPNESQTIKVNDAIVRGNLTVTGSSTAAGMAFSGDLTGSLSSDITCKSYGLTGGKSFTQSVLGGTVDASAAGANTNLYQIETVAMTLAAAASTEFLILLPTGSLATSPSYYNVMFAVYDYSGSYSANGTPIAWVGSIDPTQHRLRIIVKNIANSQALNGVLKFNISIQRGVTA